MITTWDCFPNAPSGTNVVLPVCQLCGCVVQGDWNAMNKHVEFHNKLIEGGIRG